MRRRPRPPGSGLLIDSVLAPRPRLRRDRAVRSSRPIMPWAGPIASCPSGSGPRSIGRLGRAPRQRRRPRHRGRRAGGWPDAGRHPGPGPCRPTSCEPRRPRRLGSLDRVRSGLGGRSEATTGAPTAPTWRRSPSGPAAAASSGPGRGRSDAAAPLPRLPGHPPLRPGHRWPARRPPCAPTSGGAGAGA